MPPNPTRILDRALMLMAIVLFTLIFATVLAQILFRYLLNDPLVWSEELTRYLFIWLSFTGWMIASRRSDHIRVTMLRDRFPEGLSRLIELTVQLGYILLAVVLTWYGGLLVKKNLGIDTITMPVPFALVYLIVPLAGLVILFVALETMVTLLRRTSP